MTRFSIMGPMDECQYRCPHAQANAPATCCWLRRVLDDGGRQDWTSPSHKGCRVRSLRCAKTHLPCSDLRERFQQQFLSGTNHGVNLLTVEEAKRESAFSSRVGIFITFRVASVDRPVKSLCPRYPEYVPGHFQNLISFSLSYVIVYFSRFRENFPVGYSNYGANK